MLGTGLQRAVVLDPRSFVLRLQVLEPVLQLGDARDGPFPFGAASEPVRERPCGDPVRRSAPHGRRQSRPPAARGAAPARPGSPRSGQGRASGSVSAPPVEAPTAPDSRAPAPSRGAGPTSALPPAADLSRPASPPCAPAGRPAATGRPSRSSTPRCGSRGLPRPAVRLRLDCRYSGARRYGGNLKSGPRSPKRAQRR